MSAVEGTRAGDRPPEGSRRDAVRIHLRRVLSVAPAAIALGYAVVMFVGAHATFFSPLGTMNPKDEGYITAFADRLIEGHWLPYVDAVSHRGPMLYWVAAIAVRTLGRASFLPVRVLALACSLLTVALTFAVALRARRLLAAAIAVLMLAAVLIVEQNSGDGLAYNGETLLDVFVLAAFLCMMMAVSPGKPRPSAPWAAAAGLLAMLGALSKQVGAVSLFPLAFWLAAACVSRAGEGPRLRRWTPLVAFVVGAAVPALVVVLRYAAASELRTLVFYFVTYNSKYYMAPFPVDRWLHEYRNWMALRATWVATGVLLVAAGLARALRSVGRHTFWRTVDDEGFAIVVALSAGLTGAVANGTLRDFHHYYVQAVPWFALLVGVLIEDVVGEVRLGPVRRAVVQLGIVVPTIVTVWTGYLVKLRDMRADQRARAPTLKICEYVDAHSSPSDRIYVWGFAPDFYTSCRRRTASRYVYSTFQSGYVPFEDATADEERSRVVPGSPGLFLSDLEQSRPRLIIDVPSTMGHRSMKGIPAYDAYLKEKYCRAVLYDGVDVFARRLDDGTCAPE